jgi:hypothetical protein
LPSCFTKNNMDSPKNKSGCPKKNINLPLNITFEYDVFQHVVKLQLFLAKKHQKAWIFCPKTRHPQDLLRTAGFVPDSVVSAADLPTEIAATDCDEEADMVSPRKWISDWFGTWNLVFMPIIWHF